MTQVIPADPTMRTQNSSFPAGETIAPQGLHLPYGPTPFIAGGTTLGAPINLVGLRPILLAVLRPDKRQQLPGGWRSGLLQHFRAGCCGQLQLQLATGVARKALFAMAFNSLARIHGANRSTTRRALSRASTQPISAAAARSHSTARPTALSLAGSGTCPSRSTAERWAWSRTAGRVSAIVAFQDGFPIRMQSNLDQELQGSGDFENPGKPDIVAPFTHQDPRKNGGYYFNPNIFAVARFGQPWLGAAQPVLRPGNRQYRLRVAEGHSDRRDQEPGVHLPDFQRLQSHPVPESGWADRRRRHFSARSPGLATRARSSSRSASGCKIRSDRDRDFAAEWRRAGLDFVSGKCMSTAVLAPARLPHYIGGEWVDSSASEWLSVVNPATGEEIATVPLAGARKSLQPLKLRLRRFRPGGGLRPKTASSRCSS